MPSYGARLYNGAGELLPGLPLLGVQAGTVVNGLGDCTLTFARIRSPRAWWKDARYADVWRLDAPVARIGAFWLETWTEKAQRGAMTWTAQGKTALRFLEGRVLSTTTTLALQAGSVASQIMQMAFQSGLPYTTWLPVCGSAEGPSVTVEIRAGSGALAALAGVADQAWAYLRPQRLLYDILPTYTTSGRLAFQPAVWLGEYGADRRVGYGIRPVALRVDAATREYEATEDWSRAVTVVNVDTLSSVTSAAFDTPPGNRWERTVGAATRSSTVASEQARLTLAANESSLRLPIDLGRDAWRLGLRLGDVVSVAYGGRWGTGRLNVFHVAADAERETVQARLDIEI